MSFISWSFICLLLVVLSARMTLGRKKTESSYIFVLIAASVIFYAWHVLPYILIILLSTTIDYIVGHELVREGRSTRSRKQLVAFSVVSNLSILGFFKYSDFAIDSVNMALIAMGLNGTIPLLDIVLPMGISFYTFQSISYSIDIYRGQVKPEKSFWRFFLYVSFFPQLMAGPIVRARDFLYQINRQRSITMPAMTEGVFLIIRGFFLKMVCANNVGNVINKVWDESSMTETSSADLLLVTVLFSFQIFGDFAGYSSIARGVAYLLGFRLPVNFDNPYIASSFKNFWQRWHISLSSWLRDYLYVPLGGNRGSPWMTYRNLILVMFLGGLWHGAAWHYVVWGLIHGVALAVERFFSLEKKAREKLGFVGAFGWFVITQIVVLITWIFFRATTSERAIECIFGILRFDLEMPDFSLLSRCVFILPIVAMHFRGFLVNYRYLPACGRNEKAIYAALMFFAILTAYGRNSDFIYFQF